MACLIGINFLLKLMCVLEEVYLFIRNRISKKYEEY